MIIFFIFHNCTVRTKSQRSSSTCSGQNFGQIVFTRYVSNLTKKPFRKETIKFLYEITLFSFFSIH